MIMTTQSVRERGTAGCRRSPRGPVPNSLILRERPRISTSGFDHHVVNEFSIRGLIVRHSDPIERPSPPGSLPGRRSCGRLSVEDDDDENNMPSGLVRITTRSLSSTVSASSSGRRSAREIIDTSVPVGVAVHAPSRPCAATEAVLARPSARWTYGSCHDRYRAVGTNVRVRARHSASSARTRALRPGLSRPIVADRTVRSAKSLQMAMESVCTQNTPVGPSTKRANASSPSLVLGSA